MDPEGRTVFKILLDAPYCLIHITSKLKKARMLKAGQETNISMRTILTNLGWTDEQLPEGCVVGQTPEIRHTLGGGGDEDRDVTVNLSDQQ